MAIVSKNSQRVTSAEWQLVKLGTSHFVQL